MIVVENLVFEYPGIRALDRVSFALEPRSITALVGPNGAGKSTLLRCIAGLETPLAGRIYLGDLDISRKTRESHRRLGFLSDFFGLYDDLTARRCLLHRCGMMGVPASEAGARVEEAARRCDMAGLLDRKAGELSRGQRQRLAIAQALVHAPEVLLLDEPASGLDPEARAGLSRLLLSLRDEGLTLVVSSHILSELEDYSTHMLAIGGGRIRDFRAIQAAPEGEGERVVVHLLMASPDERLAVLLRQEPDLADLTLGEDGARFTLPALAERRAALLRRLVEAGLPVSAFNVGGQSMEQAYLSLMRQGEES